MSQKFHSEGSTPRTSPASLHQNAVKDFHGFTVCDWERWGMQTGQHLQHLEATSRCAGNPDDRAYVDIDNLRGERQNKALHTHSVWIRNICKDAKQHLTRVHVKTCASWTWDWNRIRELEINAVKSRTKKSLYMDWWKAL